MASEPPNSFDGNSPTDHLYLPPQARSGDPKLQHKKENLREKTSLSESLPFGDIISRSSVNAPRFDGSNVWPEQVIHGYEKTNESNSLDIYDCLITKNNVDKESEVNTEHQDNLVEQMLGILGYTPPLALKSRPTTATMSDPTNKKIPEYGGMLRWPGADAAMSCDKPHFSRLDETKHVTSYQSAGPTRYLFFPLTSGAGVPALFDQIKLENIAHSFLADRGVIVEFFDLREAWKILNSFVFLNPCFVEPPQNADRNGNLLVVDDISPEFRTRGILSLFQPFGEVMSVNEVLPGNQTLIVVEFFDKRDAAFAYHTLNGLKLDGQSRPLKCWLCRNVDEARFLAEHYRLQQQYHGLQETKGQQQKLVLRAPPGLPSPALYSTIARTQSPIAGILAGDLDVPPSLKAIHLETAIEAYTCQHFKSGQQKSGTLNLVKILSGQDKRTTFMIRNIPNKYTQKMLLEMIDESHRGEYDFVYLRMDFKNKCNVGYAFINFVDPRSAVSFALKCCGKKWSKFNSDKICDMSYATIQGKKALIEKFRNSQVMSEEPSYRPKIFFSSGPKKGDEEPFPTPATSPTVPRSTDHLTPSFRRNDLKSSVESLKSSHFY